MARVDREYTSYPEPERDDDFEEQIAEEMEEAAEPPLPLKKYRCRGPGCGYSSDVVWAGRCPGCSGWYNVLTRRRKSEHKHATLGGVSKRQQRKRMSTGFDEIDRVLGGDQTTGLGLVPSSAVAFAGAKGAGKTTTLMQICKHVARDGRHVVYMSGEQNKDDLLDYAARLGVDSDTFHIFGDEPSLDKVLHVALDMRPRPSLVVVDSAQTVVSPECDAPLGSTAQMEAVGTYVCSFAKMLKIPVLIVCQMVKDGDLAGAQKFQHKVDVIVFLERWEDDDAIRIFYCPEKNRYGETGVSAAGYLEMTGTGLAPLSRDNLKKVFAVLREGS